MTFEILILAISILVLLSNIVLMIDNIRQYYAMRRTVAVLKLGARRMHGRNNE